MRLAIMQPYFFPYLGHFHLIGQVDVWAVFDTAQYIRRGWMNRNRIFKPPGEGWQYINAPTKRSPRSSIIKDIELATDTDWRARLTRQLLHYRKNAPFFEDTVALVRSCLEADEPFLARLNIRILVTLCARLNIPFKPLFLSETDADPGPSISPGDRILSIALNLGATHYLNPAGGARLLDTAAFSSAGIELKIQCYENHVYDTGPYVFEPGLSIIDAMMWNPMETLREHLLGMSERPSLSHI